MAELHPTGAATPAERKSQASDFDRHYSKPISTDARHQRLALLLHLLLLRRITTIEAREELGICHPAGRISELRQLGHEILTQWRIDYDAAGTKHRVADYVYMGRKGVEQ